MGEHPSSLSKSPKKAFPLSILARTPSHSLLQTCPPPKFFIFDLVETWGRTHVTTPFSNWWKNVLVKGPLGYLGINMVKIRPLTCYTIIWVAYFQTKDTLGLV